MLASGDRGQTWINVALPAPFATGAQNVDLILAGARFLLAAHHGSPSLVKVSRTDSLGFIQTASIGGCGTPSSPSWSLEGDPTAGFDLVLSTGIPLSFCFVGLSPGLLPGPIPLFGCDIHLAPQGLFATGLIADANARLLIAISPQLAGIQLYLQALVFHTLITGSDAVNLVLK
jgi:hypothetical protein